MTTTQAPPRPQTPLYGLLWAIAGPNQRPPAALAQKLDPTVIEIVTRG